VTRTLILIAALGAFLVGAVIPVGRIFYMYNIEQHPQMCGVPGDYRQCEVMP
jgi:hypothetical protein